ncbi:MAG TPA: DUF418 domain-containing protein [Allosphingosinicella sp.]|nr:DUF418 domain-containing protein [Allosphingosinicella sp.]
MTAATEPGRRIATLDIIRGVAVMGIFAVNVVAFAMPFQAYFNPSAYGLESNADLALWFATFILVDGKMRGLFSLLFGASMLLVIERAEASGQSPAKIHYSRMVWLLVLGALHYYLIWYGDILTLYAMVGMIAFLFRKLSVRALILWALGLLAFDILFMAGGAWHFLTAEAAARAPGASAAAIAEWQETSSEFAVPSAAVLAHELALFRGPWLGIVQEQLTKGLTGPLFQLLFGGAETLGYMLLGMAGLKSGFLKGAWPQARYRRIALRTLAVSIPAYAALAWIVYRSGFDVAVFFIIFFVAAAPFRLAMMAGYAALIILLTRQGGGLTQRIAAAGRAAFTNYLGTSLIACAIFYGWGLGLYGTLSRLEAWLAVPLVWALILLWSKPWLDRFAYGPFEWLWRSLARLAPQPMRRRQGAGA